jgi:phosphoribosylaminoimidazole-succinocarboxamide synthase
LEDETIPDSVRYWTTQAAAAFSDDILRTGIALSLASANEDIKEAALLALEVLDES